MVNTIAKQQQKIVFFIKYKANICTLMTFTSTNTCYKEKLYHFTLSL